MFGLGLLKRLLFAPVFGILLNLAVLPLVLLGGIGIFLVFLSAGTGTAPSLGLIFFTSLFVLFLMICVTTQMARYAGSFSGALPLSQQIRFFRAFWRTLLILFLFVLANIVIGIVIAMLAIRSGMDLRALLNPGTVLGQSATPPEQALVELMESKFILAYAILALLMSSIQAVFLVPAACGMGERFAWAWTASYFVLRLVIVVPFLAIVLFFLSDALAALITTGLSADQGGDLSRAAIRQALMTLFAMSFAMAGEAAILASARHHGDATQPDDDLYQPDEPQVADLLRARMSDGR